MTQTAGRRRWIGWHGVITLSLCVLVLLTAVRLSAPAFDSLLTLAGWERIDGGGATTCAFNTPYQFFARTGVSDENLLILFQSGGGCWSSETCRLAIFDSSVQDDEPLRHTGVLDFQNPVNPFIGYDVVFIPYCTADVHIGDATASYRFGRGGGLIVRHNGFANASAALEWVYASYPDPRRVTVAGSSAGAVGALIHAANVMARYPDAQTSFVGDSYIGIIPPRWEPLQNWNAGANLPDFITGRTLETFTVEGLYQDITAQYPESRFAIYTQALDLFQIAFFSLSGGSPSSWSVLRDALIERLMSLPNLRTFVSGGFTHVALLNERVYTVSAGGISLRDWIAALLAGDSIDSVFCERTPFNCP
jgi:hypothetical protein